MHLAVNYRTNPQRGRHTAAVHDEFCKRLKDAIGSRIAAPTIFAMKFKLGVDGKVDPAGGAGVTPIPGQVQSRAFPVVLDCVTEATKDLEFATPGGPPSELTVEIQIMFPPAP